jgi:Lhr-like helicase
MPFDRLHPALQHHVVNSLGWQDLRPFQQAVIDPVLAGRHLLILAPTAGGKTEAAFFPVLSRMLTEGWPGLSILYVCPIKALLNNLDVRLSPYCRRRSSAARTSWSCFRSSPRPPCLWSGTAARSWGSWTRPPF